jgi:hypothetical protein
LIFGMGGQVAHFSQRFYLGFYEAKPPATRNPLQKSNKTSFFEHSSAQFCRNQTKLDILNIEARFPCRRGRFVRMGPLTIPRALLPTMQSGAPLGARR